MGEQIGNNIELQWLNAEDLFIDDEYQRIVNPGWVRAIARGFDPDMLDPLEVSDRGNGKYAVTDGQHRLLAIREIGWGDQKVPCIVRTGMDTKTEAKKFGAQKNRRGLTRFDTHRADVVAEDPTAIAIEKIATDVGFFIRREPEALNINAVKALYDVAARHGLPELRYVLQVSYDAWEEAPKVRSLKGIAHFCSKFPNAERKILVDALAGISTTKFESQAKSLAEVINSGMSTASAYLVYKLYNKKTRSKRLPVWLVGEEDEEQMDRQTVKQRMEAKMTPEEKAAYEAGE